MFALGRPVERHGPVEGIACANIFLKLGLTACDDDNRRVMAVLAYLNS